MTETDRLRAYIDEITSSRGVEPRLLPTLLQLLRVPRVRRQFPGLGPDELRQVAEEFVRVGRRAGRRR